MPAQFTTHRRIQFSDTDMAGIVHFANFYKYMEEAEHEYFRSLGLTIMHQEADGTVIGWPRVRAACAFEAPAFFEDVLDIDVNIVRKGVRSLTIAYLFRRGETRIANGEMKTVCCICRHGGKLQSIDIPADYDAKLVEAGPKNP